MAAWTFRKEKQQENRVFFDVIFDVYTHVDNRESARAQGPEEFCVNKWITYLKCHLGKCLYLSLSTIN